MKFLLLFELFLVTFSMIYCEGGFLSIGTFKDFNELGFDLISTLKKVVNNLKYIQMDDEYIIVKNKQYWLRDFYISKLNMDPSVLYKGITSDCILNQYCFINLNNINLKISASISLTWEHEFYGRKFKKGIFEAKLNSTQSNISVTFVNGTKFPHINFTNKWELTEVYIDGRGVSQELNGSIISKILNYNGLIVTDLIKNFPEIYINDFVFSNKLIMIPILLEKYPNQYFIKNQFLYFVIGQGDPSLNTRFGFAFNSSLISTSGKVSNIQEIVYPRQSYSENYSLIFFMPANIYKNIVNFVIEDQQLNYSFTITEARLKIIYNYSVTVNSLAQIFPSFILNYDIDETFIINCKFPIPPSAYQQFQKIYLNAFCEFNTSYTNRHIFSINLTIASPIIYDSITTDPHLGLVNSIRLDTLIWDSFTLDFQTTRLQNSLFKNWAQKIFDSYAGYPYYIKFSTFPYEEVIECSQITNFEDSMAVRNICYLIASSCK